MSLHAAEWVAGELISLTLGGLALVWVWQQHKKHETPPVLPQDRLQHRLEAGGDTDAAIRQGDS